MTDSMQMFDAIFIAFIAWVCVFGIHHFMDPRKIRKAFKIQLSVGIIVANALMILVNVPCAIIFAVALAIANLMFAYLQGEFS